jgi:glycosyltransferase involved in cell wall biosynthesis
MGIPMVVTFHGYDLAETYAVSAGLNSWIYGKRRPSLFKQADRIVAVSENHRDKLVGMGADARKIVVHHIGVDVERFSPAPLIARDGTVLAVGRMVEKKGLSGLVSAMARVQETRPDAKLEVIGDGPLREALTAQAADQGVRVEFLGAQPSDVVRDAMKRARVFALPSVTSAAGDTEAVTIAMLEAMASGAPVVASRHAGIPEAIEDSISGLLVEERDVDGLATALLRVLADDDVWHRLSTGGRDRVADRFDLRKQTSQLEETYEAVISERASGR